jgi:DUF4097 and DUF4098 domain-containing protein YvlB
MNRTAAALAPLLLAGLVSTAAAQQTHKELKFNVMPGATVTVTNEFGPVVVKPASGHQVLVSAVPHSTNVEVDSDQVGNRIELRSHILKASSDDDATVEYSISVPPDVGLTIRADGGPVSIEGLRGDVSVVGDNAHVDVKDSGGGHVHVQTVSGPVTLTNITNGHVEITSISGDVKLTSVTGPKVAVNSTRGNIAYRGDVGTGGNYSLTNHSGNIDVALPETASVDLSARSISGTVQNDFPLQQKTHSAFVPQPGRSFLGTANAASTSIELRTFSGTIRVKKQ